MVLILLRLLFEVFILVKEHTTWGRRVEGEPPQSVCPPYFPLHELINEDEAVGDIELVDAEKFPRQYRYGLPTVVVEQSDGEDSTGDVEMMSVTDQSSTVFSGTSSGKKNNVVFATRSSPNTKSRGRARLGCSTCRCWMALTLVLGATNHLEGTTVTTRTTTHHHDHSMVLTIRNRITIGTTTIQHGSGIPIMIQHGSGIPIIVEGSGILIIVEGSGIPTMIQHGSGIPTMIQHGSGIPTMIQHGSGILIIVEGSGIPIIVEGSGILIAEGPSLCQSFSMGMLIPQLRWTMCTWTT